MLLGVRSVQQSLVVILATGLLNQKISVIFYVLNLSLLSYCVEKSAKYSSTQKENRFKCNT